MLLLSADVGGLTLSAGLPAGVHGSNQILALQGADRRNGQDVRHRERGHQRWRSMVDRRAEDSA